MISTAPNTLARRLLAAIVLSPGCWTTATLAAATDAPRFDASDYRGWVNARKAHTVKIGRILGRLVEAGLLEKQRGPRLAEWARVKVEMLPGVTAFVRSLRPVMCGGLDWPGDYATDGDDGIGAIVEPDADANAVALVRSLLAAHEAGITDMTAREVVGRRAPGALRRAYRWLCEEGVIEAPSLRWPTPAGVALVEDAETRRTA